jgi:hypothetical protein
MTRLKFLTYLVVLNGLILLNSCNDDNSLKIIDEPSQIRLTKGIQQKSVCDNELELIVTYTFDPFTSEEEQINFIETFRLDMAQYFTICSIIEGNRNCENIEKWIVNGDEYYDYINNPKGGTANTNNSGNGEIKTIYEYDGDCFKFNYPF